MEKPKKRALEDKNKLIAVFFDEFNTTADLGIFKEIICDLSLNGEKLPPNLVVFGAINPYRYRTLKGRDFLRVSYF